MKLFSPETNVSRPVTDRVKESLFNVLYKYDMPKGKRIADLFCGVGSLGLEALSRGSEFVTFIEKDLKVIEVLKKNVEKGGFADFCRIIRADAFKIGAPVYSDSERYNLIFVDPPYVLTRATGENSNLGGLFRVLEGQIAAGGLVIVRTESKVELLEKYGVFGILERRQWGSMAVSIFRKSCQSSDISNQLNKKAED